VSLQPENADGAQLIELTGLQIENEAEFGLKVSNSGDQLGRGVVAGEMSLIADALAHRCGEGKERDYLFPVAPRALRQGR